MRDIIVYIGEVGAEIYTQSLTGVLNNEGQTRFKEDRVLWTEENIGETGDNILHIAELNEDNNICATYIAMDISFLGYDSEMNNMPKYAVTVNPVSYIPWLGPVTAAMAETGDNEHPYMINEYAQQTFMLAPELEWRNPEPQPKTAFTREEAAEIARDLGINFSREKFDLNQFTMGLNTELEHGRKYYPTNVTEDNPLTTGKIALAHLREFPDYYTRLAKLEEEAKAYWSTQGHREMKEFTLSELSQYNSTAGKPAYVAVNGIVYDVSGSSKWSGGMHFSGLTAGKDLTSQFESCHGMDSILSKLPKVGILKG